MLSGKKVVPFVPPASPGAGTALKGLSANHSPVKSPKVALVIPATEPVGVRSPSKTIPQKPIKNDDDAIEELELIPEVPAIPLEPAEDARPSAAQPGTTTGHVTMKRAPIVAATKQVPALAQEDDVSFLDDPSLSEDKYGKYRKMLKCGLPPGAILQRMKTDNVPVPAGKGSSAIGSSPASGLLPVADKVQLVAVAVESIPKEEEFLGGLEPRGDAFDVYRKMIRCGLVQGAVEHKMRLDGVVWKSSGVKTMDKTPSSPLSMMPTVIKETVSTALQPEPVIMEPRQEQVKSGPLPQIKEKAIPQTISQMEKPLEVPYKPLTEVKAPVLTSTTTTTTIASPAPQTSTSKQSMETALKADLENKLIADLTGKGGSATFGDLVASYGSQVVGVLMKAKKRHLVGYPGEMLFRGKDDAVVIVLDEENAQRFAKGEQPIARQSVEIARSAPPIKPKSLEQLKAAIALRKEQEPSTTPSIVSPPPQVVTGPAAPEGVRKMPSEEVKEAVAKESSSSPTTTESEEKTSSEEASKTIGSDPEKVVTKSPTVCEATLVSNIEDVQTESPTASGTSTVQPVESSSPLAMEAASETTQSSVEATPVAEQDQTSPLAEVDEKNDDANVTGRGPPPLPPASPDQRDRSCSNVRSPGRRSILNKPRSPSKVASQQPIIESMYDAFGRRRSSGTVYRLAMTVMESKTVETIPRDAITDALNWTANNQDSADVHTKEIFSFENAEGLKMAKALEKLSRSPSKRRLGERSESFVAREKVRNQTQAAVLLQRVMRGWITRLKYRSCLWVRDRLNSAVRSRLPEKVEEALAASRAIAAKFVRPPEHERAIASLDTIREERALKARLVEIAETRVDGRDLVKRFASTMDRVARCRASDPFAFRDEVSIKAELVYHAAVKRAEMSVRLDQAAARMDPEEMMAVLRECDAAATKFTGIWEDNFLEVEKNHIRSVLVAMQHEEPAIVGLLKECVSQDVVRAHTEMIFQRTNFEELELAIAKAVEDLGSRPTTPGATQVLSLGSAILSLRKSLIAQTAQKNPSWNASERLLGDARIKLKAWQEAAGALSMTSATTTTSGETLKSVKGGHCGKWYSRIEQELDIISGELDKKAGVHDIIESLKDSVTRCDVDDIRNVLRKGQKRGLHEREHDVGLQEMLRTARDYLDRFSLIHARLLEALGGINRIPDELKRVADEARLVVLPQSTDARLVDECDRLVEYTNTELMPLINRALELVPDRKDLERVVERIRKTERMGGIPELREVEALLEMDETRLVQEQLRAAAKAHNEKRKTDLTIRFRQLHLEQNPAQFRFHNFSDLKDPKDWSAEATSRSLLASFGTRRETRAARMLFSSRGPIHAPLTKTPDSDQKLKRFAVRANRTILAYTGDLDIDDLTEFGGDVCQGLHELLVFALAEKQVRDEVYCQIMKHLTENRRPGSVNRTWNIFAFCLITFPPSPCLDMFVEFFIRNNAPVAEMPSLLEQLHHSVFAGERPTAPTLGDIKARQDDGGLVEGLGWKKTFSSKRGSTNSSS